MNTPTHPTHAAISAWVDGCPLADDVPPGLFSAPDDDAVLTWEAYQLIGQSLRGEHASLMRHDPAFLQRLHHAMAQAPIAPVGGGRLVRMPNQVAANQGAWWRWLATAASIALAAWLGLNLSLPTERQAVLSLNLPGQPAAAAAAMQRDPQLDAALAAHQRYAGGGVVPRLGADLRLVSAEGR